jgi:type I protein arginine methyltransferase
MIEDGARLGAYRAAIAATVRPGDVVLDLGAGTGIMSILALEEGAARVYAVEMDDIIAVVRQVASANGLGARLICVHGDSRRVTLPERVDVILSDIRGALPLSGRSLPTITDARDRFLKPGGRLIPMRETVFVAPVECAAGHAAVEGWRKPFAGTDFSGAARLAANQWWRQPLSQGDLLAPGQPMPALEYARLWTLDLALRARYTVTRAGHCNGVGAWFESELAPGVRLSTSPREPETVYGQAYFPLDHGHAVQPGDVIEVEISARFTGEEHVWRWTVRVEASGRETVEERHSSFAGVVLDPARLRKRAADHRPRLDEEGQIDRLILERISHEAPLGDIARAVAAAFPARFAEWEDALARVGTLSDRYGADD